MNANAIHICEECVVVWFCRNACTAGLNIFCSSWPVTGDLKHDRFVIGLREMCDTGRLGIETSGGQGLQLCLVKLRAVADIPRSRNNGSHAIVGMSMDLYPDTGRNRQLDCIY